MVIKITIADKRPTINGTPIIVCGNSNYSIEFAFDAEWSAHLVKTARFVYVQAGAVKHQDVVFEGDTAAVPILSNTAEVMVGVFAGDLQTTTPARIPCERSILCGSGEVEEPDPDVYDQIMALLNAVDVTAQDAYDLANEAKRDVNTLKEVVKSFHSNIVETARGEVIQLSDASDLELAGLKVYGKTTQNGTPTPDAPVALESVGDSGTVTVTVCGKNLFNSTIVVDRTVGGITTERQNDGGIKITGTSSTEDRYVKPDSNVFLTLPAGTYTLSPSNMRLRDLLGSVRSRTFTLSEKTDFTEALIKLTKNAAYNEVLYIQLESGSTATTYEPYTETTATVTPVDNSGNSLYLSGIPVTSGGNYTDPVTKQQRICDEVDFEKGVYVQRVGCCKVTNAKFDITLGSHSRFYSALPKANNNNYPFKHLCTHYSNFDNSYNGDYEHCYAFNETLYFYLPNEVAQNQSGIDTWIANNDLCFAYILAEPIYHDLTAEELAQYAALRTHYPNTTVYNDAGANMEVKYVADTKLYVDKKFAELSAALLGKV